MSRGHAPLYSFRVGNVTELQATEIIELLTLITDAIPSFFAFLTTLVQTTAATAGGIWALIFIRALVAKSIWT